MPKPSVEELLEIFSQEGFSATKKERQDQDKLTVIIKSRNSYRINSNSSDESKKLFTVLKSNEPLETKWIALTAYMQNEKNEEKEFYKIIYKKLIDTLPQNEASYRLHFFNKAVKSSVNKSLQATRPSLLATGLFALAGAANGLIDVVTRDPLSIAEQEEALDLLDKLSKNTNPINKAELISNIIENYVENSHILGASNTSKELLRVLKDLNIATDNKIATIDHYMKMKDDSGHLRNCGKGLCRIIFNELKKLGSQENPVVTDNTMFMI